MQKSMSVYYLSSFLALHPALLCCEPALDPLKQLPRLSQSEDRPRALVLGLAVGRITRPGPAYPTHTSPVRCPAPLLLWGTGSPGSGGMGKGCHWSCSEWDAIGRWQCARSLKRLQNLLVARLASRSEMPSAAGETQTLSGWDLASPHLWEEDICKVIKQPQAPRKRRNC